MEITAVLLGVGAVGYYTLKHWNAQPDNFGADRSQVVGSSTKTKASKDVPVFSSSYVPNQVDGRNSQIPNPELKEKDPRYNVSQKVPLRDQGTYKTPEVSDVFAPKGTDSDSRQAFNKSSELSAQHLKKNPAGVPFRTRNSHHVPRIDTIQRSQVYLGAADTAPVASIPFSHGPKFDERKHHMDVSRSIKSQHHGTLLPMTKPSVGIHPRSPHTATSLHTKIYTGRHVRNDIR